MQISGINFNTCINRFANIKTNSVRRSPFVSALSFGRQEDIFEKNPLSKFKDFTIEEYKSLSNEEIAKINEDIDTNGCRNYEYDLGMHKLMCSGMKSYLDKKYGKNNYTVITLGRSVSSLGKGLGYKIGEDNVKMLPMTSAGRFCLTSDTSENVKSFNEYLDSVGLSKENIKKSGKEIVLVDYSYTGRSLLGARKLLQRDDIWGKDKEIHIENIMDMVKDVGNRAVKKHGFDSQQHFIIDSELIFWNSLYKKYSLVDRCCDLENTARSVLDLTEEPRYKREFLFKLLDGMMKD